MVKKIWMIMLVVLCMLPVSAVTARADNEIIENDETGIPDKELYKSILSRLRKKEMKNLQNRKQKV